jgi:NAD-dependent deacetylase
MSSIEQAVAAIRSLRPRRVVFFTGAGISADSGIPTFRGPGGLWRNFRPEELATPDAFARDPRLVWEWYEWRRGLIRAARPNAAHDAIARVRDAVVVTQNVDGLHARAGATKVIELHGNIFRLRCTREGTAHMRPDALAELPPRCECGALLRPDVVWFGEPLSEDDIAASVSAIRKADLLFIIGTSGVVYPAAGLANLCKGLTIEINPDPSGLACDYGVFGRAAAVTPALVDAVLEVQA